MAATRIAEYSLRSAKNRQRGFLFGLSIVFIIAGVFRYYRIEETIRFAADQGLDMVSVWLMQTTGMLPLVGPFLSLPDVYTPPTYYIINWVFYSITHSVVGLVYLYAGMNLSAMAVLVRLAYEMNGRRMAILTGIVFGVSNVMVDHSRGFWQPYSVQFFLAVSMLFVWRATRHHTTRSLWAGVFFYVIAVSVYPSPVLLLPFITWHIFRWYRQNRHLPIIQSLAATAGTLAVPFLFVFSSQLYFEYTRGFPTLLHFTASRDGTYLLSPVISVIQNLTKFITLFFATDRLPYFLMVTATLCIAGFVFIMGWNRSKQPVSPISSVFPLWVLLLGWCGFLFYPFEVHYHRAWAFLPFAFLAFSDLIDNALSKKGVIRAIGLLVLGIYIIANLRGSWHYWTGKRTNEIVLTKRVASFIDRDMQKRQVADADADFFSKVPNDPGNGDYGIYRILFWLLRDAKRSYPLNATSIHMPHDYSKPTLKPYMYIICQGFDSDESVRDHCIEAVIMQSPYKELLLQRFQHITVAVLTASSASATPSHLPE